MIVLLFECLTTPSGKVCPVKADPGLGLSPWSVNKSERNCSLNIASVGPTEEGEWHCRLTSNSKKPPSRYFQLQVLKPAKVVLDGPAEIVVSANQVVHGHWS